MAIWQRWRKLAAKKKHAMILIADAGGTKTKWVRVVDGRYCGEFSTQGINPAVMPMNEVMRRLETDIRPLVEKEMPSHIHFYGAGCAGPISESVAKHLKIVTECRDVTVNSDLLGAARGLCGHAPGVACILGTGSNSCLYDGNGIVFSQPSMGYVLGDEGSGAVIGRRFLSDLYKGLYEDDLFECFVERYHYSLFDIYRKVYREPEPNRFLAGFMPYIRDMIDGGWKEVEEMVIDEFVNFIDRNLTAYDVDDDEPINFTGSVAFYFQDELQAAFNRRGLNLGVITENPISGLIDYHRTL